jgi:hypothetical protein
MGQIANLIDKNIRVDITIDEPFTQLSGVNKAELAIKQHIAKIGRELVKEKKVLLVSVQTFEHHHKYLELLGQIAGVEELLRRIKKL